MYRNRKKIILLDLDHTLIDTERIKKHHEHLLRRFGISSAASRAAYERVTQRNPYHPAAHVHAVVGDHRTREKILRAYWQLFEKKEAYNFPGAIAFLRALSKKYQLILFSQGHKEFQLIKLNQAGFQKWLHKTVIVRSRRKEKELLQFFRKHGDDVLLLDDSPDALSAAHAIGVTAIRVKKGEKNASYYRALLKRTGRLLG